MMMMMMMMAVLAVVKVSLSSYFPSCQSPNREHLRQAGCWLQDKKWTSVTKRSAGHAVLKLTAGVETTSLYNQSNNPMLLAHLFKAVMSSPVRVGVTYVLHGQKNSPPKTVRIHQWEVVSHDHWPQSNTKSMLVQYYFDPIVTFTNYEKWTCEIKPIWKKFCFNHMKKMYNCWVLEKTWSQQSTGTVVTN